MPQPPTIQDVPSGEIVKHGSQIVTFSLSGTLVAEEIQWSKGFKSAVFHDFTNDSTSGQPGIEKDVAYAATLGVGSMVVQIKNATSIIFPGEFVTFVQQHNTGQYVLRWMVTEVGHVYTQNGATKMPIKIGEDTSNTSLPANIALIGDFATAKPCGPIRFSRPFLVGGNIVLQYKQKFRIFRPFWTAIPANTQGLPSCFLISESELEDTGVANIVTWDREYSMVPSSFIEKGSAIKTIKTLITVHTGAPPILIAASVLTQTKTVPCDILWEFYLGSPNVGLPDVSDVSVETIPWPSAPNGGYSFVNATGGFSWTVANGGNNAGYRFLSGEIGRWMGDIYYRKQIAG